MTRAGLLLAVAALAGCDRAQPVPPDDYEAVAAAERQAAEANEQALIDRIRADVARNAALAEQTVPEQGLDDPLLNLAVPDAEQSNAVLPAPAEPSPPRDADLRAAEAAVRDAMRARRGEPQ